MEGGGGLVVDIVLYRNGYFVVVEDSTLSVRGRGTPTTHSLGWRGGGVKTSQKINKVIPLYNT